ncbi:di-heme-cytochrome C peroxidase [Rhodovulum euryhalinum]|uniref:Cytochrome c domain-containing protein n=1 Tax=Rhodovulum euryhalinum TaxID=35805 RepID=A0A4R2KQH2_9RHOB|nr:di-heme-cytochrome C peroxidase [Rhodovulum euryhalinum]TCO68855.1 hypothetical protein EV655_12233 [Rhodovulum euryhalinum]
MRLCAFLTTLLMSGVGVAAAAQTVFVDQGDDWTPGLRAAFYTQDQGSRIMPLAWMRALRLPDGAPFLHDALARYGYLPMPDRLDDDLPVGFAINGRGPRMAVGMTCAACHTREIDVNGTAYRIDGGPAIVDFQAFLQDLDAAVLAVLADEDAFAAFADAVLGAATDDAARAALRAEVAAWSHRFHTLMERALPEPPWGAGRLDAVSMIFNRLAGLDIGSETEDYLIPDNIAVADAPTRYPFLWNAARQDYTQWPGFAKNGNDLLGLARNLGEVYGVFGEFHPARKPGLVFEHDYLSRNSANFDGLRALETWVWDIGAPRWPWALDQELVRQGQAIFNRPVSAGGCVACHGKRRGERRALFHSTYATPILDVGTDIRECQILGRTVATGVLEGASIPLLRKELGAEAPAFEVLGVAVIGAIIQQATSLGGGTGIEAASAGPEVLADDEFMGRFDDLRGAFPIGEAGTGVESAAGCRYAARVLDGIWAAAPYLHNGSVPSLRALLTPPEDRVATYAPGPAYDIEAVGVAAGQTGFGHVIETTGCDDLASGNSRCGHPYGTGLAEAEKRALLEYLKSI